MSKQTIKDILRFAAGVGVLALLQEIVILVLIFGFGLFEGQTMPMLLGTVYGSLYVILSFVHMGFVVEKCVTKEPAEGKKYLSSMYTLRLLILAAVVIIAIKWDFVNVFTSLIPILYTRIVIMANNIIFGKKRSIEEIEKSSESAVCDVRKAGDDVK